MAKLLFERHVARGWDRGIMKEYILSADYKLRQDPPKLVKPTFEIYGEDHSYERDCFYLPWEFHPNDFPRKGFQRAFKKHLGPVLMEKLGYNRLVVAYRRPKNMRESLTKAKLYQVPGKEASTYYTGGSASS